MSMQIPPQPKGSPIIGHLKHFKNDPIHFMLDTSEQFGDIMLYKILNKKIYFINHPDYVKHVLQDNYKNYHKSPGYKPLRLVVGHGIFTSDGEEWLRRRKFYQPAFTKTAITSYVDTVTNQAKELVNSWPSESAEHGQVNISNEMTRITMSIISETLFSTRISSGTSLWDDTTYALEWAGERALRRPFVMPPKWPSKKNRRFHHAVKSLDELIYGIIADKKKNNQNPDDLLSRFMNPEEKKLKPFTPQELRDEVMTIFLAGHETSANVLSWTFYEIARNQTIQDKLFEEVERFGDKPWQYEDLHQLTYTAQVLSESMRLYPPVWHMGRMNLEDDEIGGYKIPAGSHVRMSALTLHRSSHYWDEPEKFDPERFSSENAKKIDQYVYVPFGAGPRLCAGRNFAMMEMVFIVAEVIRKFELKFKGEAIEPAPKLTLRPSKDILLQLNKR